MLMWLMNLDFAGGSAAAAEPAVRAPDAGAGRRVVDPWDLYGRPKRRLKVEEKRERLKAVREALPRLPELAPLAREIGTLSAQATRFEARVERAREDELEAVALQYRRLSERSARIEARLRELEARAAHRQRLLNEDEEFLHILRMIL